MTWEEKQEVLEKAIRKAIANGYVPFKVNTHHKYELEFTPYSAYGEFMAFYDNGNQGAKYRYYYAEIIFSHKFAKALWGDGKEAGETIMDGPEWEITLDDGTHKYLPLKNWQYHLQQMVLDEEPIAYLSKYI